MVTFTILHMGDLHYPKRQPLIDDKRQLLSQASVSGSSIEELRAARLSLPKVLGENPPDLLLFSGDVTDATDSTGKGLSEGCLYLHDLWGNLSVNPASAAPTIGNHDVVRDAGTKKFEAIRDEWGRLNYSLAVEKPDDRTILIAGDTRIPIYNLNSCHGSGEIHHYPEAVDVAIKRLLDSSPEEKDKVERGLYDFLDVPIVKTSEIDQIATSVRNSSVVILHAHHNILPQTVARLAVSPEMTTAGYLRRKLLATNTPVVYFHGHTHTPLVEVIRDGARPEAVLVTIGTDEFPRGFNIAQLLVNDGRAIAIRVRSYALRRDNSCEYEEIGHSNTCLLPLWHRRKYLSQAGKTLLRTKLHDPNQQWRFAEIENKMSGTTRAEIIEEIDLLQTLEYARVLNPADDPTQWVVEWAE